ncbi:hypothetical protein S245_040744, partial [Arachis hypogaea]
VPSRRGPNFERIQNCEPGRREENMQLKKRAERENARRHLLKIWTIRNQLKHHQGYVNQNFLEALENHQG